MLARNKRQALSARVGYNIIEVLVGAIVGESKRVHDGRPDDVGELNRGVLPLGNILLVRNGATVEVRDRVSIAIKAVPGEHPHLVADLMIDPVHKIIFIGNLERRSNEKSRAVTEISGFWAGGGSLEEVQIGPDGWVHGYSAGGIARMTVEEVGVRS